MKVVIIGHGGHSKVIQDLVLTDPNMEVIGFLDDKYNDFSKRDNYYFGPIESAKKLVEYFTDIKFVIGIGNNRLRKEIIRNLELPSEMYVNLIHPSAIISPSVKMGEGTVVMPNAVVNADTTIGAHVIINTRSVVEHDCIIEDFTHISPSATITGSVVLHEGTHIGAGATIIPNICIEDWSIIGAGATVTTDIPAYSTAVGIPAKIIKKEGEKLVQ
jgi:acetyltransferase EpsM